MTVGSAGIGAGAVTVSIGLASAIVSADAMAGLYSRADTALYETMAQDRNQTRCSALEEVRGTRTPTALHLVVG